MNASIATEQEMIDAEVVVIAIRLAVGIFLWIIALGLVDRIALPAADPYVANMRMGLWLFLVELLIAAYQVRYIAPPSYPVAKRAAFITSEVWSQLWQTSIYVIVNIVIRWLLVNLFTAAAIWLLGSVFLVRLAAFLPSAMLVAAWLAGFAAPAVPPVIRGTHIGSYPEAVARAAKLVLIARLAFVSRLLDQGFAPPEIADVQIVTIPWGGVELTPSAFEPHFLLIGTTNAGKTLCIRMLLKAALMANSELQHRSLIYDGKREFYPLLIGMGIPAEKILITNPADARCAAWAMAKDVQNREDAMNLTHILIPEDKKGNDNPFFLSALRSIVTEVMVCLHILSPGKWRLIDVVNAVATPERIKRVLNTTKEGEDVVERYFTDAVETVGGIISTIDARFISQYYTIACIWARCEHAFSLTEWVKDRSILLLGYDANRVAVDRINQAIFQRATELICSFPEDTEGTHEQSWIVLDEVRFTGKLPKLSELISFGRTKGARVILAPQDIDGLYDVYGEHAANEMLSLCGNVGILRLNSPKTRVWAKDLFGDYEAWEIEENGSVSHGSGPGGNTTTRTSGWSRRRTKRESVLPSDFFNLPVTDRINGMHGFFATPKMGAWRAEIPPDFIDNHLSPRDPDALPFVPRPNSAVDPVRWNSRHEKRYTKPRENRPRSGGKAQPSDQAQLWPEPENGDGVNDPKKPQKPKPDEDKPQASAGNDALPDW